MPSTIAPDKTKSSRIPRAGQLIGAFVRAFELRLNLSGAMAKAAERYFAGNDVVEANRKAIHQAIANAISDDVDLVPEAHSELVRATLIDAMSVNEEAWNDLAALLDHHVTKHAELNLVAVLFAMLGTIDIALRVGAIRHVLGVPIRTSIDDITWATSWALDEHPGILLSRWKDRAKLAQGSARHRSGEHSARLAACGKPARARVSDGPRPSLGTGSRTAGRRDPSHASPALRARGDREATASAPRQHARPDRDEARGTRTPRYQLSRGSAAHTLS